MTELDRSALDVPELRLWRSFIVVAEELHFGRAAARLHIAQPPLSVQIRKLEDSLGVRLFERSRRHVALTEAGAFFLTRARHLLRETARACEHVQRVARGEAGILTLGYTPTATYEVLPALLSAFRKRFPDVSVQLRELRSGQQSEALRSGQIEVGIACGPVADPQLEERVLASERLVVVMARTHSLAGRKRLRPADLLGQPFVAVRPDVEPAWANACTHALAAAGVAIEVTQETDTKLAMLGLVSAGVGLSVVSESMTRLAPRGVVFRPLSGLTLRLPVVGLLAAHSGPRARAFIEGSGPRIASTTRRRRS